MGKGFDYSSISVITGDPNLSIQQLGVPSKTQFRIQYTHNTMVLLYNIISLLVSSRKWTIFKFDL